MPGKTYDILDHPRRAAWYGALLNNDGACPGVLRDGPCGAFDCADIRHGPSAQPLHLGGCVDADEDDVCFGDGLDDVGGEDKVWLACLELDGAGKTGERDGGIEGAISGDADHFEQAVLVDGKVRRVPRSYALLVQVDDVDQDLGVVVRDYRGSRSTCRHCQLNKTFTKPEAWPYRQTLPRQSRYSLQRKLETHQGPLPPVTHCRPPVTTWPSTQESLPLNSAARYSASLEASRLPTTNLELKPRD